MYSKEFAKDAAERALKTAAQTALTLLTIQGADLLTLTTAGFWSAVGLASIISILTSIVSSQVAGKGTASLVK